MTSIPRYTYVGKSFTLAVPNHATDDSTPWLCHCCIVRMTPTKTIFRITCGDWFDETVPVWDEPTIDLTAIALWEYLCDTLEQSRIEYLCTL